MGGEQVRMEYGAFHGSARREGALAVFLRGGAEFAAEGGNEVAAGFEAELETDFLDGQFLVGQQVARALQQHAIIETGRRMAGGREKEARKPLLAAA